MGTKNGTWVPSYQSFDDHEKTARLSAALVVLGVPEAFASDVVWGQWKRLAFWLLANGADGRLLATTPRAFAHILRWDDVRKAKALWDAWMQSGFIDHPNTDDARLHDFREAFAHIIAARERSANLRARKYATNANSSRTVPELSADDTRTVHPPRVRASGPDRTGPYPLPPATTVPRAGDGGVEDTPNPSPSSPSGSDPGPVDNPDAPIRAAWNAARARRKLPPLSAGTDLSPALSVLAAAAPGDPDRQAELAAAYVGYDDPWLEERGWSPKLLAHRIDAIVRATSGSRMAKPPVAPETAMILPSVLGATWAELVPYARPASEPFTAEELAAIEAEVCAARPGAAAPVARWRPPRVEAESGEAVSP